MPENTNADCLSLPNPCKGISLENIFQKFERADNAHKSNIQGTGLGLYMALKIIEAMGGTITAYSEGEGKGSRFVLELPLVV